MICRFLTAPTHARVTFVPWRAASVAVLAFPTSGTEAYLSSVTTDYIFDCVLSPKLCNNTLGAEESMGGIYMYDQY